MQCNHCLHVHTWDMSKRKVISMLWSVAQHLRKCLSDLESYLPQMRKDLQETVDHLTQTEILTYSKELRLAFVRYAFRI